MHPARWFPAPALAAAGRSFTQAQLPDTESIHVTCHAVIPIERSWMGPICRRASLGKGEDNNATTWHGAAQDAWRTLDARRPLELRGGI
jgi:hypothetical protein